MSELTIETAAYWGAFLYQGMLDYEQGLSNDVHLNEFFKGSYLELVTLAVSHLPTLWQEACQHPRWLEPHPGVFEYEVVSALGVWFADTLVQHKTPPSDTETRAVIRAMLLHFFNQV